MRLGHHSNGAKLSACTRRRISFRQSRLLLQLLLLMLNIADITPASPPPLLL